MGNIRELEINSLLVYDPDHSYISKSKEVSEDELAIVPVNVNGKTARLLIDSWSNVNIISKKFLESLPTKPPLLGVSNVRLLQAISTCEPIKIEIVNISIKIGSLKFEAPFRVVDDKDSYYDLILGYYTQFLHRICIIAPLNSIYYLSDNMNLEFLCDISIGDNISNEEKISCFIKKLDINNKNKVTSLIYDKRNAKHM